MKNMVSYLAGVGAALALAVPTVAHACSCGGGIDVAAPTLAEHPANGLLVFSTFCGGSIEGVEVTVDGAPAALEAVDSLSGAEYYGSALEAFQIAPAPATGQEVVVTGCRDLWTGDCTADAAEELARFTATDEDQTPPPPAAGVDLSHARGEFYQGCNDAVDFEWTIELTPSDEANVFYQVALEPVGGGDGYHTIRHVDEPGEIIEIKFADDQDDLESSEYCATVTAFDSAANASESIETCDDASGGCGCKSGPWRAGWAAMLLLPLLMRRRAAGHR